MKKLLTILIFGIFCLSFASASNLGTFPKDSCVQLYQLCESCTFVNLTSVKIPPLELSDPMEIQIFGELMNNFGFDFTFEYCNTSRLGSYQYNVCGDKGGVNTCENIAFSITKTGTEFTISEAVTYLILAFGVLLLFLISFYFMIVTPYSNSKDDKGAVLMITKLKYVKLGLILLTWVLFTWFLNILIGLSDNFVSITMYYGFFGFIFQVMNNLALPLGIVILVIGGFEIIRDSNIYENLKKFGKA